MIGGATNTILQAFTIGAWLSRNSSQKLGVLFWDPCVSNLAALTTLFEAAKSSR